MIRCEICKKTVFDADKMTVDWKIIKTATDRGFIPSYYLERDKEGIEYGLPKERKWKNIVKTYPKESMEMCRSCYEEMSEATGSGSHKAFYCYIATAAYGTPYANEVKILRKYRNNVLQKSFHGRVIIGTYNLFSPPIARIISRSETLKSATRRYVIKPLLKRIPKK
jgi:hypothetical protein